MIGPRAQQVKPSLGFQFCPFPVELLRSTAISPAAKLLMAVLMDSARSSRSGLSKLCNATLGARIGKSASEAGRHLAELEAAGLVRREYGPSKRIRVGVAIAWAPEIQATSESTSTTAAQPGSANPANRVQRGSATIQTPPSEPSFQTGSPLSLSGEKTPDPKPTAAEIAAALRSMVAGKHAPALFDAKGSNRVCPPTPPCAAVAPPDVKAMAKRVGYSAVAAIVQAKPPRKTADQQLAELAAWSRRPSPAPPSPADVGRTSLRIPHTFGGMVKAGKL